LHAAPPVPPVDVSALTGADAC